MNARVAPQMYSDADTVRRFIAEYLGIDVNKVTDEAHLADHFGLDWLDQLELMVLIEEEFVVDFFANTTAAQIELVGDLIRPHRTSQCRAGSPLGSVNFKQNRLTVVERSISMCIAIGTCDSVPRLA
jgi:acyl carrier protein